MLKSNFIVVVGLVLLLMSTVPVYAQTANQSNIDAGITYLRSTQNPDGSWGGTATSLNTTFQTTATTARTFQLLEISDATLNNALNFLSAQSPDTVDGLFHQIEVLSAAGGDVSSWVASIKLAQQEDGGWGLDLQKIFVSDVVDTLSALRALRAANAADTDTVSKALASLLGSQNTDGGWGAAKGFPSEVFYTALSLLTLKDFQRTFNIGAPIVLASNYLVGQQNSDGSFGSPTGTAFETALALQAMLRFVVDPVKTSSAVRNFHYEFN